MHNLFMTDLGPARVSYREAHIVQLAADIRRNPIPEYPALDRLLAKADAIEAACLRFAEFSEGVRD